MYIKTKYDDVEIEFGDFESPRDISSAMYVVSSAIEGLLESGRIKKLGKLIQDLDNDEDDECVPPRHWSSGRYPWGINAEIKCSEEQNACE